MKTFKHLAAACLMILALNDAASAASVGNVTAVGKGSCSAINGTFPAFGTVVTTNGKSKYFIEFLASSSTLPLQAIEDVLNADNTLSSYDTSLFGITTGKWSGPISVNNLAVIVIGADGSSTGAPLVLDTPIAGFQDCIIDLTGLLFFTGS